METIGRTQQDHSGAAADSRRGLAQSGRGSGAWGPFSSIVCKGSLDSMVGLQQVYKSFF